MSRIAKEPVPIPSCVDVRINKQIISIKGDKGTLTRPFNSAVEIKNHDNSLLFLPRKGFSDGWTQAGTSRSLFRNMVIGVTKGFSKKLHIVGVGYRATIKESILTLNVGFSHEIKYKFPNGIIIECPTQTEIVVKGIDKEVVGQVSANLRFYRKPEPYKGKGIRYADEVVKIKEAKKK
jgi:large subunit ribosomal protein L6